MFFQAQSFKAATLSEEMRDYEVPSYLPIGGDFLIFGVLIEMPAASQVRVDMRHGGADRV